MPDATTKHTDVTITYCVCNKWVTLRVANTETYTAPPHKRATHNCPYGCDYFDCAINDKYFKNCAVYVDGKLDCVNTYRNYYLTKEWDMKWNKGKDKQPLWYKIKCLSCSNDYQCAMCWYDAPSKKRVREDVKQYQIKKLKLNIHFI